MDTVTVDSIDYGPFSADYRHSCPCLKAPISHIT
jgi:hypothetical protein